MNENATDQTLEETELSVRARNAAARNAAVRFLERRAYEIKEINWICAAGNVDIIAKDADGTIVFVNVLVNGEEIEEGFPESKLSRKERMRLEIIAANYLSGQEDVDVSVRFDSICLIVISSGKAFLKHHINACVY